VCNVHPAASGNKMVTGSNCMTRAHNKDTLQGFVCLGSFAARAQIAITCKFPTCIFKGFVVE